ncbi:iron ABC transporter permease [Exilibacterium tricleocarpae]|uniref:Iron ABC transporter permease n=2 Tax=Exilibacterium tricleocarpae TaxID=2591008 RepID=A0A545TK99_9GAMM|nr:iron ABC transporter permease [Exilibacterium tricleocarpae]
MAGLVLLPVSVIVLSWGSAQTEVWQHLIATQLSRLLGNTLILVLGVGVWVMVLGVSLAWFTATCEFPGRRWLDWALMLPLAIPTYVVAFVALGLLGYSGPVQTLWRHWFGADAWFPDIRGAGGVVMVMTTVLYPYVYMLARAAFLAQGRGLMDASRLLGNGPWSSFLRVALPMARPAIVAGTALALMECLADFGAVSVLNYDTFTTAIYKSWFGFFNLQAAAQLASLLLLFVFAALYAEQRARGSGRIHQQPRRTRTAYQLTGWRGLLVSAYCTSVVVLAFVVPVLQLLVWVFETRATGLDSRYGALILRTFTLGGSAALITVAIAVLVAYGQRVSGRLGISTSVRLAGLGYALPGSVLAVGILLAFAYIDRQLINPLRLLLELPPAQILVGSVAALVLAYVIRFFSVAVGPVQAGLERIKPHFQEAAHTLGAGQWRVLRRIYLPLLAPGLLTALLLVLVDTMKEMPATLLLRPFGWDTLAVRVFELTSEGEWQRAALPALTLVLLSIPPVVIMVRRSRAV